MDPTVPNIEPVTTPPEPPVIEKPKTNWATSFLFLILGILIGAGGLWGYQTYLSNRSVNQTVVYASPTPTSDPTANWKTYIDPKGTYSFKYPEDWAVSIGNSNAPNYPKDTIALKGSPSTFDIELVVEPITTDPRITLSNFVKDTFGDTDPQILSSDSKSAKGYIIENGPENSQLKITIDVLTNNQKSLIATTVLQQDKILTFDQILSTFKFLGQTTNNSTWKTYTSSDGLISFNNPGTWILANTFDGVRLNPGGNIKEIDLSILKDSPVSGQSLDSWYKDLSTQAPYDGAAAINAREAIKLVGLNGIKLTEGFEGVSSTKLYIWNGTWVLSITVYPAEQFNSPTVQNFLNSLKIK